MHWKGSHVIAGQGAMRMGQSFSTVDLGIPLLGGTWGLVLHPLGRGHCI